MPKMMLMSPNQLKKTVGFVIFHRFHNSCSKGLKLVKSHNLQQSVIPNIDSII